MVLFIHDNYDLGGYALTSVVPMPQLMSYDDCVPTIRLIQDECHKFTTGCTSVSYTHLTLPTIYSV